MQLSEHFSLAELTRSETAERHGIANTPSAAHLARLKVLAAGLEQVRALFGAAVHVTVAYRNPEVNRLVGGVANSDHCHGDAGDIHVAGLSDKEVAHRIAASPIQFDQLILEGTPAHPRCVHFSTGPRLRRQVLYQPGRPGSPISTGLPA